MKFFVYLFIIVCNLFCVRLEAEEFDPIPVKWTPIQIALSYPNLLFSKDSKVYGFRLTLFRGINSDVNGIDIGLGLSQSNNITGIQATAFANATEEELNGVQIAGIANLTRTGIGAQLAFLLNYTERFNGIQLGFVNVSNGENSSISGIQFGFANYAKMVYGVQIGILNYSENIKGVQIGLLNFIMANPHPYVPILNARF